MNPPRFSRRISAALALVFVLQLLFGAGLHFHQLSDYESGSTDVVHADFSHEVHGDQSGLDGDPSSREQVGDWSLDPVPLHWPRVILADTVPVEGGVQLVQAPQPPPRYTLPQPRDPPLS
ncbi:hypothetical protein ACMDCT_05795 [Halomonadaceae bacterium KBTZ08]